MKSLILLALTTLAFVSTTNALCLRTVDGKIYNLCPFENPNAVYFNALPTFAANLTFGLAKGNAPSCLNSTQNAWFSFTNDVGKCAVASKEPVVRADPQGYFLHGVALDYSLDGDLGQVTVNLMCNGTAPHNADVNFFVDGVYNDVLYITAYSYYGCPVKAADAGRTFLQF